MQQLSRSNVVEVNGVQFQTEIQSVIPIPILPGTRTPVRLGIRVTNNTLNRLYFNRLDSLYPSPIVINSNGNETKWDSDMWRLRVKGEFYYSVASGQSEFFPYESFLSRGFFRHPGARSVFKLQLKFCNEAGGFYYFQGLKCGTYRLHLFYKGYRQLLGLSPDEQASMRVWDGEVTLPFVEFRLSH